MKILIMFLRHLCVPALLSIAWVSPGLAQVDTATLNGTVTDSSGGVIAKAKVRAVSISTGEPRDAVTNRDGIYTIPKLPAGDYTVGFSSEHFDTLNF